MKRKCQHDEINCKILHGQIDITGQRSGCGDFSDYCEFGQAMLIQYLPA